MRAEDIERLVSVSRPTIAHDGAFAVFATSRPSIAGNRDVGRLFRVDLDTGDLRPLTRGVAKNPVDHPHGGGEGRTSGGRHPVTPWGKPTKGARTRHNKATDKMIIRSRHARKK